MAARYSDKEIVIVKVRRRSLAKGRIIYVYHNRKAYEVEFDNEISTVFESDILCSAKLYCGNILEVKGRI